MFVKFVPDKYKKNVYSINYNKLKRSGIKCLLFDLDNTLVSTTDVRPDARVKKLFFDLKNMGFKVIIMSNSPKNRVEPFKNELCVDSAAFSLKPRKDKYLKIMEKYNYKPEQIAAIGDQLVTDVFGANRVGIVSILVNPMGMKDFFSTKFNRIIENIIFKNLTKKELFIRGKYYD